LTIFAYSESFTHFRYLEAVMHFDLSRRLDQCFTFW